MSAGQDALLVKLTPPATEGVYPRRRLMKELDRLRTRAAVWVTAPGGSGKTTLVASYLKERRLRCAWYQVDAGDADLPSFFHHLALAVRRASPRHRRSLPQLTPEYLADVETFARWFFREIGRRLKSSTPLVLDDVQEAGPGEALHRVLRICVEELSGLVPLIFISRADPPSSLARLRLNGRLRCLDWNALKLREDESRALVKLMAGDVAARSNVSRLHRQCDGWVAGLILLLGGASSEPTVEEGKLDWSSAQPLFDYFASEILAHRTPEVREFLLLTALFPAFTASMAEALTGRAGASELLEELVSQHHFTERHGQTQRTYRYHPLFRDFLREQGARLWNETGRSKRLVAAATILENAAQLEHAQLLYLEIRDHEAAARVILAQAPALVAAGRLGVLRNSISQLPASVLENHPWLRYWRGVCHLVSDLAAARADFEFAYRAFRDGGDAQGSYLAWAGVVDSFVFLWGEYIQLRGWIAEFEKLRRDFPKYPSRAVEERAIYAIFTAHVFAAPEWDSIGKWVSRAERVAREAEDPSLRIMTVASLALYYPWVGELQRFETLTRTTRDLARSDTATPFARLSLLSMQSRTALLYGDVTSARAFAEEATALAESSGVHIMDRSNCAGLVYACAHLADLDAARVVLERYRGLIAPGMHLEEALWTYLASFVELLDGRLQEAEARGRHAVRLARQCEVPFAVVVCSLHLVRVLARAGRHDEAEALIEEILPVARAIRSHLFECECALSYAWSAGRKGDIASCLKHLRRGLSVAQRHGLKSFIATDPNWLAELCAIALEHDIQVATAREMIRVGGLAPPADGSASAAWPWPVRIRTLGMFDLRVHDEPVRFAAKAQKRPLELLRALIALGGRAVPEEQLTELLWPESDGDAAHRVFDTTVHRLRKVLGSERAVIVAGGTLTLDAQLVWVDAWAFERAMARSESADPKLLERAVSLYSGAFLGTESAPWTVPMRERLRSMFLRAVEQLGAMHEARGRLQDAIQCYRRGIEADPLAEALYGRLMICYEQLDRHSEGLATFERLRAVLSSQLGVKPSARTRELQERLRRSAQLTAR
ncbi:winged helix-turn-helix domain-containing protein [Steroidobacter sp. S1-65]|uniref:Winged helix-turn-helix domain-containing protein n=1 Tax=Steroidobacter gossypii TaxID=2805490 RepID=A0ABS1WYF7_9GAMM|nr:BTAD domain-containing putative transcriptional regulator [Steroidobacter gossypii]MBM0106009.1 winged helix-turn-helix domain-containing protein [Steroidobacter gossypii]